MLWSLLDLIKQKYNSTGSTYKPMDFARVIQFFTLDVITSLGLGQSFGYITDGEDIDKYEYVKTMEDNFPIMNFLSAVPFLAAIMQIPSVQRKSIPSVKDRVGMGKVKAVTAEIISRRFGDKKEVRQDMTQSFTAHGLTQGEIADESLLQILAGSDTSTTILRSAFISIIGNPHTYTRFQEACMAANVPLSEIVTYCQAQAIPYLVACVREGLRHHPAASGLLPRMTGPEGEHHNGMYIPPNTEIGICAWNMHGNNPIYGEDAGLFRPERWLENSPDKGCDMERAQDLVFGFGRYRCMGERIAKVELHKTMFELMRRFGWSFCGSCEASGKEHQLWHFLTEVHVGESIGTSEVKALLGEPGPSLMVLSLCHPLEPLYLVCMGTDEDASKTQAHLSHSSAVMTRYLVSSILSSNELIKYIWIARRCQWTRPGDTSSTLTAKRLSPCGQHVSRQMLLAAYLLLTCIDDTALYARLRIHTESRDLVSDVFRVIAAHFAG